MAKRRIQIVVPPFASVDFPMIGPSIIAAECCRRGHTATVFYANMLLASHLGYDLYSRVSLSSFSVMLGDLLFRDLAFPGQFSVDLDELLLKNDTISVSSPQLKPLSRDDVRRCMQTIPFVLPSITRVILDFQPEIVGFSSSFQQNLASISIARAIKAVEPRIITVLGGPNASKPMVSALAQMTSCFDVLFSGEADFAFANYVDSLELKRTERIVECQPVAVLDSVIAPDYSDYFEQLTPFQSTNALPGGLPHALPIESSRGCWWGEKHHCTFCGLNGDEMTLRSKSPDRITAEFERQETRYAITAFQATDNIMPKGYVKHVLPRLATSSRSRRIFYEVKSNLRPDELNIFAASGITSIQPGIESFSSKILMQIDKGVSGPKNICLLRNCASRQIEVIWNMLVAIPGDQADQYVAMSCVIPFLEHLHPPRGLSRIVIDRFSPYHSRPLDFGISEIAPLPAYSTIYPNQALLKDVAYHFTGKYRSGYLDDPDIAKQFEFAINSWQKQWFEQQTPPKLYMAPLDDGRVFVEDTRIVAKSRWQVLDSAETLLLRELEKPVPISKLLPLDVLGNLLDRGLVVEYEGYWFSVVVDPSQGVNARLTACRPDVAGATDR